MELRQPSIPSPDESPVNVTPFHKAAAVLSHFDPDHLKPTPGEPASDADFRQMLGDSVVLNDAGGGLPVWSLRLDARQRALREMHASRQMLQALDANPDRDQDDIQRVFERYLRGDSIQLDSQTPAELSATARVVEWLGDLLPNVPSLDALQARLERDRMLGTFRSLADQHFRGRTKELEILRDYVGVLPPSSVLRGLVRAYGRLRGTQDKPLLILGTGGVGKSSLLARFVLEHADAAPEFQFPFVYLDFDRPELMAEEPLTLIAEAARQLAVQNAKLRGQALAFRQRLLNELYAARRARTASRSNDPANLRREAALDPRRYGTEMYGLLEQMVPHGQPLLIVFDTFEQAQHRGHRVVELLFEFIGRLRSNVPALRVVISGRAPIEGADVEATEIGPLDTESAVEHLISLGIPDTELAQQMVDKVGGHPLCLRLAARLALETRGGVKSLMNLKTRGTFFLRLDSEMIQGLLYERLLHHLDDWEPQIDKLAHPGLVLRRLTPELIAEVLAKPCKLDLSEPGTAERLFHALENQLWVVERDSDGSLHHRADLRALMLPLLQNDMADAVRDIHNAAINYYARDAARLVERAEELYHRLMLGHDASTLQSRWIDGVQPSLWKSYEELPTASRVLLATLSGERVDPKLRKDADLEAWEKICAREATRLLQVGRVQEALGVLQERKERSRGSALFALEAEALLQLGDVQGANRVLGEGIDSIYAGGASLEILPLVLRKAEMEAENGMWPFPSTVDDPAGIFGEEFEALSTRYPKDPKLARLGMLRLRQLDRFDPTLRRRAAERRTGEEAGRPALPSVGELETSVMRCWESLEDPHLLDLDTQFELLGALAPRFRTRAVVRVADVMLGSQLASLAISEEGTSRRRYRDALATLGPVVDEMLNSRAIEEGQTGTLREAEGSPSYPSKALTYGKLIDELIQGLHGQADDALYRFGEVVMQTLQPQPTAVVTPQDELAAR